MFQICYASKTTSNDLKILNDLRDILDEARHFNVKHDICGVLYFADEYFFQCLEGDQDTIEMLLDKLFKDPRHHQIKLYQHTEIKHRHFSQWSMKYVKRSSQIQQFFLDQGYEKFAPLCLSQQDLPKLLHLLYEIEETEL